MNQLSLLSSLLRKLADLREESEIRFHASDGKDDRLFERGRQQALDDAVALLNDAMDAMRLSSAGAETAVRATLETYRHPPHPHPRSRVYRSEPPGWVIQDTTAQDVFEKMMRRMSQAAKAPLVIFDLDGTLFDVGWRTLGILQAWLASDDARRFEPALVARVAAIDFNHIGYSLAHAFENAGLDLRDPDVVDVFAAAEKNWRRRFFDGRTLVTHDREMPGASAFAWRCARAGLRIAYLTGRHADTMTEGTRAQLRKHNFPEEGVRLVLKANHAADDHEFKEAVFRALDDEFSVVGNFENEYVNVASMAARSPECVHVIVDSQHSARPVAVLSTPVHRITDFLA